MGKFHLFPFLNGPDSFEERPFFLYCLTRGVRRLQERFRNFIFQRVNYLRFETFWYVTPCRSVNSCHQPYETSVTADCRHDATLQESLNFSSPTVRIPDLVRYIVVYIITIVIVVVLLLLSWL